MALTVEAPLATVLYIGLLMEADDRGSFEWKPLTIKARVLPAPVFDIGQLFESLISHGFIKPYEMGGRKYGAVRNFCRFQRPRKPKFTFPIPDELLTYVAIGDLSTESEPDEHRRVPQKSALNGHRATSVPQKSGKSPQMEDGGSIYPGKEQSSDVVDLDTREVSAGANPQPMVVKNGRQHR